MTKSAAVFLFTLLSASAQALEIESSRTFAGTQLITLNASEEHKLYGDVEAQCNLYDKRNRIIDTANVIFDQSAVVLRLNSFRWAVRVDCTFPG
ncbi:hypothetical protein [Endozoicomonas lisbonensis]|uniref:Organic solvent tolerance-like N-terminal domain-containing protein n=1 Tax=Endozoicomonas lisbonensis TaxID=3120522 RepID=A0ABV2SF64_9GAMM